jgi:hypothetical protein
MLLLPCGGGITCGMSHPPSQPLCMICLMNVSSPSIQSLQRTPKQRSRHSSGQQGVNRTIAWTTRASKSTPFPLPPPQSAAACCACKHNMCTAHVLLAGNSPAQAACNHVKSHRPAQIYKHSIHLTRAVCIRDILPQVKLQTLPLTGCLGWRCTRCMCC